MSIWIFTHLFSFLTGRSLLFSYWSFASQSTIPTIDDSEILVSMIYVDPVHRSDAKEAKDRLATIVHSMSPELLPIKPDTLRDRHGFPFR